MGDAFDSGNRCSGCGKKSDADLCWRCSKKGKTPPSRACQIAELKAKIKAIAADCRRRSEQFASYGGNDYTDAACQMDEIAKALEGT